MGAWQIGAEDKNLLRSQGKPLETAWSGKDGRMNRSGQNRLSPNNEESGPGPQSRQTRASSWRLLVWALFFALVFWLTRGFFGGGSGEADAISYSTFREALGEGQVERHQRRKPELVMGRNRPR